MRYRILFSISIFIIFITTVPALAIRQSWNKGRGYLPFYYATEEGILIENTTDSLIYDYYPLKKCTRNFILNFRAKNLHGNPSKKYLYYNAKGEKNYLNNPHWGFFITSVKDTLVLTVKGSERMTATETIPGVEINLYDINLKEKKSFFMSEELNPYLGDNIWTLALKDKNLTISGGERNQHIISTLNGVSDVTGFGFFSGWGGKVLIQDLKLDYEVPEPFRRKEISKIGLEKYFLESEDEMEGFWVLYDRDLEESLLKFGGEYLLACVKDGDNYNLLYIDGAEVNYKDWKTGDMKAYLKPSVFPDIFEVEWIDSLKESLTKDIKAQKGEGNTLLFQFPYQSSKFRLRKIQMAED